MTNMRLKQKLSVSYLLFTFKGRLSKGAYWLASLFYWSTFYVLFNALWFGIGPKSTFIIYPLLFWAIIATSAKRLHDTGKSGYWLSVALIPVIGPLWLIYHLGFRKGNYTSNKYGRVPGTAPDYHKNDEGKEIPHLKTEERIIDDVTKLNPVLVKPAHRFNFEFREAVSKANYEAVFYFNKFLLGFEYL